MKRSLRCKLHWMLIGPLLLVGSPALAEGELDTLAGCVRANFPKQSSIQEVTLRTEDRGGSFRELTAKIWWQRFKPKRS
ncbi:MAG: hypothetical protein GY723_19675, partial [bacterium]|nr:hypothetical protein [bacterium]